MNNYMNNKELGINKKDKKKRDKKEKCKDGKKWIDNLNQKENKQRKI